MFETTIMSGSLNISNLSYKELQALALRYRVPGNIKKQLLIEVLQAARCGNEQEVDKLLADLRQNRKKRIRKGKPTKLTMSLTSTPIHSPTYDMADDYYAAQHRLPYQWVGAEEEIPNRQLDEANRIPQYEEFRQFLLRRIQRDYQTYNINHTEKVEPVDSGGIMDLRNDQAESFRFETDTAIGVRSNTIVPLNSLETVQSYSEQMAHTPTAGFDYQILEDPNGNGNASILLRRMLQAPAGADLGEIASPELGSSCRIWGNDQYPSQNNLLDNSDTLSANSDINGNEDNNWPIGTEYYRFVNNVKDHLMINTGKNIPGNRSNFDQLSAPGQFCNVLGDDNPVQYQLLYSNQMGDVQEGQEHQPGQQQWETAAGSFHNDVLNYQKPKNQGSKMFALGMNTYYDGIGITNYTGPRLMENDPMQQQYLNDDGSATGYSANQNGFEMNNNSSVSAASRSEMKFYQNLNNNMERDNAIVEVYSSRQINEANNYNSSVRPPIHSSNYYISGEALQQTQGFIPPMQNLSFSNLQQQTPPPAHNGLIENLTSMQTVQPPHLVEEFNRPSIFAQYHMPPKENPLAEESPQLYHLGDQDVIQKTEAGCETEVHNRNKTILGSTSTTQSDSSISLEPYWPQRSVVKNTTSNCLENILNLNAYGYIDYSKIDQTSCIYCYSAPIVTQKLFTGQSQCSQKKRFIAEFRQHTFSPYWLLYNDANTGMQMSRHVKTMDKIKELGIERENDGVIKVSVNGITDITLDLENAVNNHTEDLINDTEFQLNEQRRNSGVVEPITGTNQYDSKEMSLLDSNGQLHSKSGISISVDTNGQDETESSINLNMENGVGRKDQFQDESCDVSEIECSENLSTKV